MSWFIANAKAGFGPTQQAAAQQALGGVMGSQSRDLDAPLVSKNADPAQYGAQDAQGNYQLGGTLSSLGSWAFPGTSGSIGQGAGGMMGGVPTVGNVTTGTRNPIAQQALDMVMMKSPTGQIGHIHKSRLQDALAAGGQVVQ